MLILGCCYVDDAALVHEYRLSEWRLSPIAAQVHEFVPIIISISISI